MKRTFAFILAVSFCLLSLAACYNDKIYDYDYPEFEPGDVDSQTTTNIEITTAPCETTDISTNTEIDSTETSNDDSSNETTCFTTESVVVETYIESFESTADNIENTSVESNSETVDQTESTEIEVSSTDVAESIVLTESTEIESTETEATTIIESASDEEPEAETESSSIHVDTDENHHCDICGKELDIQTGTNTDGNMGNSGNNHTIAIFDKFFDKNYDTDRTSHSDGGAMNSNSDSYTDGDYELKFHNYSNVYKNACDGKGNPALKIGKTDSIGSFEFTVADDVNLVIIRVAKYKNIESAVTINNQEYELTKNSDDGEYDEIIIDTSKTKTIVFATTLEHNRCMVRSIEFVK